MSRGRADETFFVFKQKTAYEMRISDWSSDVCSSDLGEIGEPGAILAAREDRRIVRRVERDRILRRALLGGVHRDDGILDILEAGQHGALVRGERGLGPIGRASCRERVCQYVSSSVVAVSLKKKKKYQTQDTNKK